MSEEQINNEFEKTKENHPGLFHRHVSTGDVKWFAETQFYLSMNRMSAEELWFPSRWLYQNIQDKKTYCSECRRRINKIYGD